MTEPPTAWVRGGVAAALGLYAALALLSVRDKSMTFDECIHLPPGYVSWTLRDHRMNPDHPPLVRKLAALPLLLMDVRFDPEELAWKVARPWEWGRRFLFRLNDAQRLLTAGRLPITALGMALGWAIFCWTRRHWGLPAAALALVLFALDPDMIAHGQIVSNDLAITLLIFLTVVAFERLTDRFTLPRLALAGLALGAALATKYSGVGLLPILGLLSLVVALAPGTTSPGKRLATLAGWLAAMLAVAWLVLWAAYGFHKEIAVDPEVNARFEQTLPKAPGPAAQAGVDLVRRFGLLPDAYVWGFLHFLDHTEGRPAFLLGEYSETGWWYYFPVTFALKTPVPLLLLFAVALVTLPGRSAWRTEAFLWLPLVFYFGVSMTQPINIGHRHLLPIYPFVFVAAGRAALLARSRHHLAALGLLVAWHAAGTARAYPDYLAYFNELGGGPQDGWRRLVDSSLDWGQDLPGLKRWMDASGVPKLKLSYFGTADPGYYGVVCERLPGYLPPPPSATVRAVRAGDVLAVSATLLQGVYLDPEWRPLMARLRGLPPLANVGGSILVYRASFDWSPP